MGYTDTYKEWLTNPYFDEETNERVTKALVVVDGKVINPNGFYIFKKS